MAVFGPSPEAAITSRLQLLARRARKIKPETTIDPPLQVSALLEDDELLLERIEPAELRELTVENAAKNILYPILNSARIQDSAFVDVWNLLDIIQGCVDRDLCSTQLVLLLVEEVMDSLSIADCHIAFNFLESRREAIMSGLGTSSKELVVLRTCNELLRRLSRAEDPVFCGRVYIFLFQSFPLGHKGSVNLRGEFHVGNVTTFEDYIVSEQSGDTVMEDVPSAGSTVPPVSLLPCYSKTYILLDSLVFILTLAHIQRLFLALLPVFILTEQAARTEDRGSEGGRLRKWQGEETFNA